LEAGGFDFSSYKSSPLASISTTLKRFKPEDVETAEIDGVAAYRWIGKVSTGTPNIDFWGKIMNGAIVSDTK
jgi:hypothetical protein